MSTVTRNQKTRKNAGFSESNSMGLNEHYAATDSFSIISA